MLQELSILPSKCDFLELFSTRPSVFCYAPTPKSEIARLYL